MKTLTTEEITGFDEDLLRDLAKGEVFVITHEGRPVAQLSPSPDSTPREEFAPMTEEELQARAKALANLSEFRKTHSLGGLTWRELIEEGRRF